MAAGVSVTSSSNQPGNDNADIKVRGQGTLNSSAPLVIIDGVEAGINTVNPQDIETMSVLKDAASAAIYGSRAANGVILITTKQGKSGAMKIDYNGYVSFASIRKTHHVVVAEESNKTAGIGAELAAMLQEEMYDELDGPIGRVAAQDVPMPYNISLEKYVIPDANRIAEAVRAQVARY